MAVKTLWFSVTCMTCDSISQFAGAKRGRVLCMCPYIAHSQRCNLHPKRTRAATYQLLLYGSLGGSRCWLAGAFEGRAH